MKSESKVKIKSRTRCQNQIQISYQSWLNKIIWLLENNMINTKETHRTSDFSCSSHTMSAFQQSTCTLFESSYQLGTQVVSRYKCNSSRKGNRVMIYDKLIPTILKSNSEIIEPKILAYIL